MNRPEFEAALLLSGYSEHSDGYWRCRWMPSMELVAEHCKVDGRRMEFDAAMRLLALSKSTIEERRQFAEEQQAQRREAALAQLQDKLR